MFKWLKTLFKKKKNNCCDIEIKENTCETCVWWKAEEDNGLKYFSNNNLRYCDAYKQYTKPQHTCALYHEERFEATADSVQTEEYELNSELSIEGSQLNGTRREKK